MVTIRENTWCSITGPEISKLNKKYGSMSFNNVPESDRHVYYSDVELEFHNPSPNAQGGINAVIYSAVPLNAQFGYTEINQITTHWNELTDAIQTYKNTHPIDPADAYTDFYQVGRTVAIQESCVVFYDDSKKQNVNNAKYANYIIILVDPEAEPDVTSISAIYEGDPVPVETAFDESKLKIEVFYDDGTKLEMAHGHAGSAYTIEPADKIVQTLGDNYFTVTYIDPNNDANSDTFTVRGCKNLHHIRGYWDGNRIAYGKEAQKKFFVIIACYTDGTESTVTDFSFPNTNIVTEANQGIIDIFYQGKTCQIEVPYFEVQSAKLTVFYKGPDVEIDRNYLKNDEYFDIKVYYSADDSVNHSYYDTLTIDDCTFDLSTLITKKGPNIFHVSYESLVGTLNATFTVTGFNAEIVPQIVEAEYIGPKLYQGSVIDPERIHCNVYYSNGKIETVKNFSLSTNIVNDVGINEITLGYVENFTTLTTTVFVEGVAKDPTSTNNVFPTELQNSYPKATVLNNRYRGPAESIKTTNWANMIIKNLNELYQRFQQLEKQYNKIVADVAGDTSIKITTLNNVSYMDHQIQKLKNDDHYATGVYVSSEEETR